ncbi:MAG: penicillin-binding protein 2 [Kiritimatiellae bacterium]|nr:penicillin-binding protein 2 [Kiritimatiellia bacterium]
MRAWSRGHRLLVVLAGLLALFAAYAFRLTSLHTRELDPVFRGPVTREVRIETPAPRGRILDRNGTALALDVPLYRLNADPEGVVLDGLVVAYAELFARLLGLDRVELQRRLQQPERRQVYLADGLTREQIDHIRQLKLRHIWWEETPRRQYPLRELACHVVGFVNAERVGAAGIEMAYHRWLKGRPGVRVTVRNARRQEIADQRRFDLPAEPGATVELTLDAVVQTVVEDALDEAVRLHRPLGAWAIVLDVRTGEVLAMASRPAFDPNNYGASSLDHHLNRAIGYVYEPGSTFKAATIAAALDAGVVRADTPFDCEHGVWYYRGRPLRDFHPYGQLTVAGIVQKSSNIGAAKIAVMLGDAALDTYLRNFGFGTRTGIELPGEESGILPPRRQWDSLTATRIAMGHSVAATALQMISALGAIGNGGVRMKPVIVRRVTDARGRTLHEFSPTAAATPLRADSARLMTELLVGVTAPEGTGRRAAVPGYRVAGKTGTAIKAGVGGYDHHRNIASFMGLIPADSPALGIIVVVDEPQPEHTGGVVAAPVFRQIAQDVVRYLGIPPSEPARPAVAPGIEMPPEGDADVDWSTL